MSRRKNIFKPEHPIKVYWNTRGKLAQTTLHTLIFWRVGVALSAFLIVINFHFSPNYLLFIEFLQDIITMTISLSVGILGFLIAGFAVFVGFMRIDLLIALNKKKHVIGQNAAITELQQLLFVFMNTFTVYIGLLSYSILLFIFFSKHSPIEGIISAKMPNSWFLTAGSFGALIVLIFFIVAAILRLIAFVWNIYAMIVNVVVEEQQKRIRRIRRLARIRKRYEGDVEKRIRASNLIELIDTRRL